jgi:hypothetical protein
MIPLSQREDRMLRRFIGLTVAADCAVHRARAPGLTHGHQLALGYRAMHLPGRAKRARGTCWRFRRLTRDGRLA